MEIQAERGKTDGRGGGAPGWGPVNKRRSVEQAGFPANQI